ncbi:type I-E CRISPR-associated protein Cse2/CasB [Streptomyces bluensis]|uniref:Type I-E CRISPR-associated protein Cse2/CasB n=1 Tax=Streptomyces bluensis TaxID=33897 RepID=A0ABW6UVU4_9ACTN
MSTTEQRRAHYDAFVAHIHDLCQTKKIRADLELGRGRPVNECKPLHRYLSRAVARHPARRAYYTIASFIAMQRPTSPHTPETDNETALPAAVATHPDEAAPQQADGNEAQAWRSRPNLGKSLALAVRDHGFNASRTEDNVYILTGLSTELLHPMLWSCVRRLLAADVAIDWAVLLEDLAWWDHDQGEISTRWLDSFHVTLDPHPTLFQEL